MSELTKLKNADPMIRGLSVRDDYTQEERKLSYERGSLEAKRRWESQPLESERHSKKRAEDGESHHPQLDILITSVDSTNDANSLVECDVRETSTFHVDYSVRGTAKCKLCRKVISRDLLRIWKSALYKERTYTQYHHVSWIFKKFQKARTTSNIISDAESLLGFTDLREDDQITLWNLIACENESRKKILPSSLPKRKPRVYPEAPLHIRKASLKPTNAENLTVLYTILTQISWQKRKW